MKSVLSFIILCYVAGSYAQTGSEIYIADLKISKAGVSISNSKNITKRIGYDNQPYFHPDQPLLYFSSFNDSSRAEIKSFHYKNNTTTLLTQTHEREYSPTITPDKKFISCIIQRDNGAQDLGKYSLRGGAPIVIIDNMTVGYHVWLTPKKLLLFILGEPNTLRLYDASTQKDSVIQQSIGRALHNIPGQKSVSFVDKRESSWKIKSYDGKIVKTICETLPNREDLAWTPDGKIIMSDGRQLFYLDTHLNSGWKMFFTSELSGISRIAISTNGKKIAYVVSE